MATTTAVWRLCYPSLNNKIGTGAYISIRNGHHLRGKPPGVARSIQQRLAELNYKDPELTFRVDIGLPPIQYSRSNERRRNLDVLKANRKDAKMEKLARDKKLLINIETAQEEWIKTEGQSQIKAIADHFGIYRHLFGDAYFIPRVPLKVLYSDNDTELPVYYGNVIKPVHATIKPKIDFKSEENTLWTLILTNPDGHFTEHESEYVHWFVGNIPGNTLTKGETVVEYLQPFPCKGTGYHRHIFILYKQEGPVDYSEFKRDGECLTLSERTFSTLDFYRKRQEILTPAGLAFFQSDWDSSLTDFYHHKLGMREPVFEYDFPPPYRPAQKWFPLRKSFNLYMDRYRDPKQINKEFLVRKLKDVHPFKSPPAPLPFPNAQYFDGYIPSWLKLEIKKSRLKWGRINEI